LSIFFKVNTFKANAGFASNPMHHQAILKELYSLERFGIKLGLTNITDLLRRIGNPQDHFPAIHVTGTAGKGSVCAFIDSVLREAGYRTGIYTSPHLIRFNERIKVSGREISDDDVVRLYEYVKPHTIAMANESRAKQSTFFEITTAMAFTYFYEREVDVAILEVGMGGRMDATNVVHSILNILTRIGLEHTEHLGKTVKRIAREKSGIMKPNVPTVTVGQEALQTLQERAKEVGCPLVVVGVDTKYNRLSWNIASQEIEFTSRYPLRYETTLLGAHQAENAAIALTAIDVLEGDGWNISDFAKQRGITRARWPARFQIVRRNPYVIVDGAHNPLGTQSLVNTIEDCFPKKKLIFVLGVLNDKDLDGIAKILAPVAKHIVATGPKSERAFSAKEVSDAFAKLNASVETVEGVAQAIGKALEIASPDTPVCIAGSIYVAGEALQHFQEVES